MGHDQPELNFVNFATYVSFFPQIVAGPIQRSGDFLQQIDKPSPTPEMMTRGLRRLLMGCFKKTVVADNLGAFIAQAYSSIPLPVQRCWPFTFSLFSCMRIFPR